jgi:serine/threonine protein kinase
MELLRNEMRVLYVLDHPKIVHVNDLIEDDDNYYIVTEVI